MPSRCIVGLFLTFIALAGCGGSDDVDVQNPTPSATTSSATSAPAPSPEESPTGDATPSALAGAVEEFVATVRQKVPDVASGRADEEIASVAELACQGLAAGTTPDQLVALVQTLGTLDTEATDQATARELVKLALDTSCPEHSAKVDDF